MSELVSCLMVTRNRVDLARRAIDCFAAQRWPNRELVVLDDGDQDYSAMIEPFTAAGHRIRYERIERREGVLLGALRNRSIELADGDWCMQWDDDEWYHPDRIGVQMDARRRGSAVALKWTLMHLQSTDLGTLAFRADSGVATPGTVLHRRDAGRYPNLSRNEDGVFLQQLRRTGLVVLGPEQSYLFVRCFHGTNTWDERHFVRRLHRRPADWLPYARARLAGDLRRHRAFALGAQEQATIDALTAYHPTTVVR
jgi:glycosyltransferase involved in cell wall biosynthesis